MPGHGESPTSLMIYRRIYVYYIDCGTPNINLGHSMCERNVQPYVTVAIGYFSI
jgi:hypothetical protein